MKTSKPYRRFLKWLLISCSVLLLLLLLSWGLLYYFVAVNKKPLLQKINSEANKHLQGEVHIGDLSLAFWKDFPHLMLEIKDVSIRDSMYAQHQHKLLHAERIFISARLPDLFSSISTVEKVSLENVSIYAFTDSTGYNNTYAFKLKEKPNTKEKPTTQFHINEMDIKQLKVHLALVPDDKQFDFELLSLAAQIKQTDSNIYIEAPMKAHVDGLGFLMTKGPFLVNKNVHSTLILVYDKKEKIAKLPRQEVIVAGEPFWLEANAFLNATSPYYSLTITNENLPYDKGFSLINVYLQRRLAVLSLNAPVSVKVQIDGALGQKTLPLIRVDFSTRNNQIQNDYGIMDSVNFHGYYYNNWITGKGHVDSNSAVFVDTLCGRLLGKIPFIADSVVVYNLIEGKSEIQAKIHSQFDLLALNDFVDKSMRIKQGKAKLEVLFKGTSNMQALQKNQLYGSLKIEQAALSYLPRNLDFKNVSALLKFDNQDILLQNLHLSKGKSVLNVNGKVSNILSAITDQAAMVQIQTQINSPFIDLEDFTSLAGKKFSLNTKTFQVSKQQKQKISQLNQSLEKALDIANMNMNVKVDKLVHQKFTAKKIQASLALLSDRLEITNLNLEHANGNINLKGKINQNQTNNPFSIQGDIKGVQLNEFLKAFDNFGMKAITSENISGNFSSFISLQGNFTDAGTLLKNSIKGNIDFKLKEAVVYHFEPFMQIKKYVFKRRGLDSVTFLPIQSNLIIEQGKVFIFPLEIRNNIFNLFIKGVYAFEKGTEISIEIPMENPKADNQRVLSGKTSKRKKCIFLVAQDGSDGSVHISWDRKHEASQDIDARLVLDENGELTDAAFESNERKSIVEEGNNITTDKKSNNKNRAWYLRLKDFYLRTIRDDGKVRDD